MCTLRVNDVLKDRILVTRESARLLQEAMSAMIAAAGTSGNPSGEASLGIDFEGVEGMAPSFLDELLSVFESLLGERGNVGKRCLIVANPPTRLSLKFEAIARGHGMSVRTTPNGSWLLTETANTCD